jgi:hypothetical protein
LIQERVVNKPTLTGTYIITSTNHSLLSLLSIQLFNSSLFIPNQIHISQCPVEEKVSLPLCLHVISLWMTALLLDQQLTFRWQRSRKGWCQATQEGPTRQHPVSYIGRIRALKLTFRGITKPAIRRLARRGGVKRISGLIYEETRGVLKICKSKTHSPLLCVEHR